MPRNVLNTTEVDRFLDRIVDDYVMDTDDMIEEAATDWLKTAGRRWMIKTYPDTGRVISVLELGEAETPGLLRVSWSDKPRRGGQSTYVLQLPRWFRRDPQCDVTVLDLESPAAATVTVQLTRAFAYVNGQAPTLGQKRLARISVPDAIHSAGKLASKAAAQAKSDGTSLLLELEDGFTLVHLTGEAALEEEGERMSHCVGDYGLTVRNGSAEILSLRDEKGQPHATIEVLGGVRVTQMKGKGNQPVDARYRVFIRNAVDALGLSLEADQDNIGLTTHGFAPHDPCSWMNHPTLPDLIQEGLNGQGTGEYDVLLNDVAAALPEADPEFLEWVTVHFIRNQSGPVHANLVRKINLCGAKVDVLNVSMAGSVWQALGRNRTQDARRVRAKMGDAMAATLLEVDRTHPHALVERPGFLNEIGIDWKPIRHARRERMRQLFSGFGSTFTKLQNHPQTPVAQKDAWHRNWYPVSRYLNGESYVYF